MGRAFLVVGSLLLAFTAYQLWGTAVYEHQAQDHLRSQLDARLGHGAGHLTKASGSSVDSPA
jgi:hypothetical protein